MAAACTSVEGLRDLLRCWGTNRFHIEFPAPSANDPSLVGQFFSSHLLHTVVALHHLGASVERLEETAKEHASSLSPATEDDTSVQLTWQQCKDLLGKRKQFPELSRFFRQEMETRTSGEVVGQYLPEMLDGGLYSALFHPYIHIGYGLLSGRNEEVADGLAYMVMSCRPTQPVDDDLDRSEQSPSETVSESIPQGVISEEDKKLSHPGLVLFKLLREDERLQNLIRSVKQEIDPVTIARETGRGAWSNSMFKILDRAEKLLERHVAKSGLLSVGADDEGSTEGLVKRVFEGATLAYALSRPADNFFLLHGLTSAWMLTVIAPHLSVGHQRLLLKKFCVALSAMYVSLELPRVGGGVWPDEANIPSWDVIKEAAIVDNDWHTPKVVFSCHEAQKVFGPSVVGVQLYRMVSACRLGLLDWP